MIDLVHKGDVHNVQDPHLLGDLGKFIMTGRIGVFLCRNGEEELFLRVVFGQGVDTDVVEGVSIDGIRPGDGARVDRSIDQQFLGNFASEKSNSVIITFFFRREKFVIIFAQEYRDLAGVKVMEVPVCSLHLLEVGNKNPEAIIEIPFNGRQQFQPDLSCKDDFSFPGKG